MKCNGCGESAGNGAMDKAVTVTGCDNRLYPFTLVFGIDCGCAAKAVALSSRPVALYGTPNAKEARADARSERSNAREEASRDTADA